MENTKYVIVWMDETEGPVGVTGPHDSQESAIKVVMDQIADVFANEPMIFKDVMWVGGWKLECELGEVAYAQILSLDSDVYS